MTNELTVRVERPVIPAMNWNKDEVQKNLDELLASYTGRVYTPESIKDAKADRAAVNKWDKQLAAALTAAKRLYTDPLEDFQKSIREMQAQCKKISGAIDQQVKAVEQAWDQGFVVVTAAGNMGPAYGSVTAPGSSKKVITVGASDMLDRISSVSGAGPTAECVCKPDLVAPGADVISCANKRNSYAIKSGTSMSTPKVSGAIALLLQKDPLLTNVEVKMLLRESCIDLGYPRNRQGWGKLDIRKLLTL